uniref:Protein amnionless n=1 Tax=Haemonchus contortus TaxID=6289 RepID=A0A7I4YVZ0_HAECO
MSTHSFTRFVKTMEGQYQVLLGHALAKESFEDNVSRMLPVKDPVIILNKEKVGDYNPNIENKTLSLICNYVQCPSTASNCTTTVRPFGHCCDVCAGLLTFASESLTVSKIFGLISKLVKEIHLDGLVLPSVERINGEDDNDLIPRFQVAVFQQQTYDDTISRIFIKQLHNKLMNFQTQNGLEYFNYEYDWSLLDHSYAPASKIAGLVTFCIVILIAAALFWRNADERERFRAFVSSNTSSSFRVVWHPGKEDDDVVQLVNSSEDLISEEEDPLPTSFSNMNHEPVLLQSGAITTGSPIAEELTAMEMKMIE